MCSGPLALPRTTTEESHTFIINQCRKNEDCRRIHYKGIIAGASIARASIARASITRALLQAHPLQGHHCRGINCKGIYCKGIHCKEIHYKGIIAGAMGHPSQGHPLQGIHNRGIIAKRRFRCHHHHFLFSNSRNLMVHCTMTQFGT